MIKKTISLLLAVFMLLTMAMPTNVYAASNDYAGHWAEETIQLWLNEGRITGYPDGSFKPNGNITRAEFVTMVNKLFNFTETTEINFSDVNEDDWYYQEVQKAFKAGYIAGVSETQFAPNSNLTREQAAVIVAKVMKLDINADAAGVFTDNNKISSWALDFVGAAAKSELIKGYTEDNTFKPQNIITRAEAVVTLNRTIEAEDLVVDEAGTVIENKTVRNLHISENVGSGEVTLKNVTVTGELLVEGGGLNTVSIEDSNINKLTTNKADGKVRILLIGGTEIDLTSILSGATLEQQDLTGDGFVDVVIEENANTSQTVTIKADIKEFAFKATIKVNVVTGVIESLIIDEAAEDLIIDLGEGVQVLSAIVNTKVSFTGKGTIEKAEVNADGVTFEKKPEEIISAPPSGGSGSGGSGGGNSGGDNELVNLDINIEFNNSIVEVNGDGYEPNIEKINLKLGNTEYSYVSDHEPIDFAEHISKLKEYGIKLNFKSNNTELLNIDESTGIMSGREKDGETKITVIASKTGYKNVTFYFDVKVIIPVEGPGEFSNNAVTTKAHGKVDGYIVDVRLADGATFESSSVVVSLLDEYDNVMQKNTLKSDHELTTTSLTVPFDVKGEYKYEEDSYWIKEGSVYGNHTTPSKVLIEVTLANGKIITDTLENIIPVKWPGEFSNNAVTTKAHGKVDGYIVDVRLADGATFENASVVVSLLDEDDNVMQKNTLKSDHELTTTSLTVPFDVKGEYKYEEDSYWIKEGSVYGNHTTPSKVLIEVTLANGKIITDILTGVTPVKWPGEFSNNAVTTKAHGKVDGYIVDVRLADGATFESSSVIVSLLDEDDNVMQKNTLKSDHELTTTSLTVPFDVKGTLNYEDDGFWLVEGSTVKGEHITPSKVLIEVTLANGKIITDTLENIVPVKWPGEFSNNAVTTKAHGKVDGYIVDVRLADGATFENASVVVSLIDEDENVLQKNTLKSDHELTTTSLTVPFDVKGEYKYEEDSYWIKEGSVYGNHTTPSKVLIEVTLANGKIITDTLENIIPVKWPGEFSNNAVTTKAHGKVDGYIVDVRLADGATFESSSVIVSLLDEYDNVMQKNTLKSDHELTTTSLTVPFDVKGTLNYEDDGFWLVEGSTVKGEHITPSKVLIEVTLANGKIITDTLENIIPVKWPGEFSNNAVTTKAHGKVDGYIVDVRLADGATFAGAKAIISLVDSENNVMQSNRLPDNHEWTGTSLTVPFDVKGTYDYNNPTWSDKIVWELKGSVKDNYTKPTKVIIVVTLENGKELREELTDIKSVDLSFLPGDVHSSYPSRLYEITTGSGIVGYGVVVEFIDFTLGDVEDLSISVCDENGVILQTNTLVKGDLSSELEQIMSSFDVSGTFDYEKDGYWETDGSIHGNSTVPEYAVADITLKSGKIISKEIEFWTPK